MHASKIKLSEVKVEMKSSSYLASHYALVSVALMDISPLTGWRMCMLRKSRGNKMTGVIYKLVSVIRTTG